MPDAQPEAGGERRTALLFGSRRALRAGAPSASAFGVLDVLSGPFLKQRIKRGKHARIRKLFLVLTLTTSIAYAQTPPNASQQATGTATHVPNAEIQAALQPLDAKPVADAVLRVVAINAEYNVGVSIVRRRKVDGRTSPDAIMHHEITEVYHVLEGSGILVTGGVIEGEKEFPRDSPVVRTLVGPSSFGTAIAGGARQRVGPGDVVIIPPNTPHGFSEIISDQITYLLVRVDPHRVLSESERKP